MSRETFWAVFFFALFAFWGLVAAVIVCAVL